MPQVTEGDIERAEALLGVSFDAPRRQVLLCNQSVDVQACPGSGKTTLLVAKLAILATKWKEPRRGICVLSHTNVARQEVERRLATSVTGQRLLCYPHFIGTIHGFVNEFLALPWLRSQGLSVRVIDDDICGSRCRSLLYSDPRYKSAKVFLQRNEQRDPDRTVTRLRFEGPDLKLCSAAGKLPCGEATASYSALRGIKERTARQGYWRYDDMFALAEQLLERNVLAADMIRRRFPAVFIDEMQDTSEMQSRILAKLFPPGGCALRQRFGDTNQAIYDAGQAEATTDTFPSETEVRELPNSKRFGAAIASLADSLACRPITPALVGQGPPASEAPAASEPMPNTVFLFEPENCLTVLPAFGGLLLASFGEAALGAGSFRAVGHTGKKTDSLEKLPRSLSDYFPDYQPEMARSEPRPATLADFFCLAARLRSEREGAAEPVEMVAKGLVELLHRVAPGMTGRRVFLHRWIEGKLAGHQKERSAYRNRVWRLCVGTETPAEATWSDYVGEVRRFLRPLIGEDWSPEAAEFCEWSAVFAGKPLGSAPLVAPPTNVFRYARDGKQVDIQVGTIHSAKGQTHRATLVLETFYKTHDLGDLVEWLAGGPRGWHPKDGKERGDRLRLVFTAMTRPTHLLCLAMRSQAVAKPQVEALRARGWQVVKLG